jgi:hypothetical protein
MIAQRFKSVAWVAGVALAATLLYIISLQVATERGRLEQIDMQISETKRDIRQLQTEFGTRASLRQLERWNGEALALAAPSAEQYLPGEAAISDIDQAKLGDATAAPPPMMAAVMMPQPAQEVVVAEAAKEQPLIAAILPTKKPEPRLSASDKAVQTAIAGPKQKPKEVKVAAVMPEKKSLLAGQSLASIKAAAKAESSQSR